MDAPLPILLCYFRTPSLAVQQLNTRLIGAPLPILSVLRKAHAQQPTGDISAHLGEVLWQQGEQEQAKTLWQEAVEKYPDDSVLKETMQRFLGEPEDTQKSGK